MRWRESSISSPCAMPRASAGSGVASSAPCHDVRWGSRPFPKTRKVAWLGGQNFAPLGWVLLMPA